MILNVAQPTALNQSWAIEATRAINQLIGKSLNVKSVTASYTLENDYDFLKVDTTSGNITVTLPAAALHAGRLVFVKRMTAGANTLTVDGNASETIDGAATLSMSTQYEAYGLYCDGSNWLKAVYIPSTGGSGLADGDYGDISVSGTGTALTIDNDVVTYAKMQNVSATSRFLGRITAGAGDVEELTAANAKTILALTQSDISGLTTADSPQFTAVNLGHASDTTISRVSAGVIAVEGVNVITTAGGTFTGDISVPDEAYDATNWDGSVEVPTKNAIRDKIESLSFGGLSTIETLSPSGVSSIDIEGFAGGGYDFVEIYFNLTFNTDDVALDALMKLGGSYQTANYRYAGLQRASGGSTNPVDSQSAAQIRMNSTGASWGIGNASSAYNVEGHIRIFNPDATTGSKFLRYDHCFFLSAAPLNFGSGVGSNDGANQQSALTGIRLQPSSGTFSGTIVVRGEVF